MQRGALVPMAGAGGWQAGQSIAWVCGAGVLLPAGRPVSGPQTTYLAVHTTHPALQRDIMAGVAATVMTVPEGIANAVGRLGPLHHDFRPALGVESGH